MYTGSTSSTSKSRIAEDFQAAGSTTKVLIATIAYGMGVNVKGLKQVVVYDIPKYPTTLMQMMRRRKKEGVPEIRNLEDVFWSPLLFLRLGQWALRLQVLVHVGIC
jgi:hypothetical protein